MKKSKEIAYHFTSDELRDGRPIPAIGEWLEEKGPIVICQSGLHASRTPFQALPFAPGFLLHKVEVSGIVAETDDKLVARKRKILATIDAEEIIVSFARKQALSVIHLFDCPSILKKWLETGDPTIQKDAASAANATYAANAANAANAASAAAYAANAAAFAATYAATYAASAANAAAYAASAAANAAYAASAAAYAASAANAAAYAANAANAANAASAKNDFNEMVEKAFKEAEKV